jgi:hypothetical protein
MMIVSQQPPTATLDEDETYVASASLVGGGDFRQQYRHFTTDENSPGIFEMEHLEALEEISQHRRQILNAHDFSLSQV